MDGPRTSAAMVGAGRVVGQPRLAPDASVVAFVAVTAGQAALVVVPVVGGPETVLSTEPAPISVRVTSGAAFDWTPDGSALVYAAVDGGLWRQPVAGGPPSAVVARLAQGRAAAPAVSPDGARVAFVVDTCTVCVAGLDRDGSTPWPQPLSAASTNFAVDPVWSPDATMVAWHEWDVPAMAWDASRIVVRRADGSAPARVVAGGGTVGADGAVSADAVAVAQPLYAPDGRLGFLSDEGGWQHLRVHRLWGGGPGLTDDADLGPDAVAVVGADGRFGELGSPTWGPGIRTWTWSPNGDRVALRTNVDGFSELLVVDLAVDSEETPAPQVLARAVHAGLDWRGDRLVAVRTGARTPHQIVAYDLGGAVTSPSPVRTVLARGPVAGWEAAGPGEPEVMRWTAADGVEVTGRLYWPSGATASHRPPLLCWVHGGPTDQWPVTFNARITWFADRGWAILVPDHRGSTGHGRAYQQAMAGRWGELDVDDCAAGVAALVARGAVDATRVVAMGASAGGFTALGLLARHPACFAAGVALSAVADLVDLAERSHRFERHYPTTLVGALPAAGALYHDRSPLHLAEAITAPVLLLHGSADEVVPVDQARALAARLTTLGRDVELHVYDGEGHGWGRAEVVVDELDRIEGFLRRWVPDPHGGTP